MSLFKRWIPARARVGLIFFCTALPLTGLSQSTYRIGEDSATADAGPVRMARFSLVTGSVDTRETSSLQWSRASVNLPIREGAQIWTPEGSRAEVQFDDGSVLRLGGGAVVTLATLYSDDKGEFTEIKLTNGLATLHLKSKLSLYQVDTTVSSVKAYGPALIRIGDTDGLEVAVRAGECVCEGDSGKITLKPKQYLDLPNERAEPFARPIPKEDGWDKFNDQRDDAVYQSSSYLPSNINIVAGNIGSYGSWRHDPQYGAVWTPRGVYAGWRPYHDGHWTWVSPFGWTWVGAEPWGWAPYHYGSWVHESYGWGWCPGPAAQCWSPAVVDFSYDNGNVAWCALSPGEIRYGAGFSLGFSSGNWALSFSIGGAACYYPSGRGWCAPSPWNNRVANLGFGIYDVNRINSYYTPRTYGNAWARNRGFQPRNAQFGGGSIVASNGFAGNGRYQALPASRAAIFRNGSGFAGAPNGRDPISGPLGVHTTSASFTSSRTFASNRPSQALLSRSVVRSAVPTFAARQSVGLAHSVNPTARMSSLARAGNGSNAAGRTGARTSNVARANAARPGAGAAPANRFDRFNAVSKSKFTRPGEGSSRPAANTNRVVAAHPTRAVAPNRSAARTSATGNSAAIRMNKGRTAAGTSNRSIAARPARSTTANRASATRTGGVARARNAAASRPARAASASRPTRSYKSPVRPSRSYVRPAASKGGATDGGYRHREPTMDRTFRSAPTRSAPQDHAPSRSAPRASAPRSGGGGGNRGGGRRH